MHAALITGKQSVELREFPDPTPALSGVVVDVALCGICGTDIHAWQSGDPYPAAVCGHEWMGVVSAAGADVRSVAEGDRVVVAVPPACGVCTACTAGHATMCTTTLAHATGRHPTAPAHGGFAPSIAVDQKRVLAVAGDLSDVQAAQVEPATVALHAVRRSSLRLGDVAVIQGAGPIGLLTLQIANNGGAGQVIVVEPHSERREMARVLGANVAVHPDDARQVIADATNGLGADIVYECAGLAATVQSAVDLARRGGTMCLIGLASGLATIDPRIWLGKEISVQSALAYTHEEFAMAMAMMADGRLRVEEMHSATVRLEGLSDALAGLSDGTHGWLKVLVDPRSD